MRRLLTVGRSETDHRPDGPAYSFTGREWDSESGLYFFRMRYYDPHTGRFTSEDPIRQPNLYPYVENQPTAKIDPYGLCPPEGPDDPCRDQCDCNLGSPGQCVECKYTECLKKPWDKKQCEKDFTKACEFGGCTTACHIVGVSTAWYVVCEVLCHELKASGKACEALAPLVCAKYEKLGGRRKDCWDKRKDDKENWIKDCL